MIQFQHRKLGRKPAKHDARTLRFASYLKASQYPAPPLARDWTGPMAPGFGAMLNDRIGCCSIASAGHAIQSWSANHGSELTLPDSDILDAYRVVSGYDPDRPETDGGAVYLDAMNHWRKVGVGGHKIEAYVSINPRNKLEMEAAINLFGGIFLGIDMPEAAHSQTVWDVAPPGKHTDEYNPGSWGGHAVYVPTYSRTGLGCITWGQFKIMTWEWEMTYTAEAFAVLGPEWASVDTVAPNGFDIERLRNDLTVITR